MGIRPGDPIIPVSSFEILGKPGCYLSKAFDNRVGCALAIEAVRTLASDGHPNVAYAVGTVQEEVGTRGAKTSAFAINPDVGIVLVYDARMIPNLKLRDLVIATAEELEIDLQFSAMPGGATDGAQIHLHNEGVPTVVIGVPTRHIHSHNAILCREDYDKALELIVALVKKLDAQTVAGLTP